MIAAILSYLVSLKFWAGVVAGAAIGGPALKAAWRSIYGWAEAHI
jgi:hypothetical protein